GANFEILVGFELTPEQLAFNTDGKRFRLRYED
ncbi:MAG TPA: Tat pathway signal sequence domain protein, partial [Hyphomonadaceae bacterium]|nr:Tat pathway signal sequence domain protein [Hyphomonadaceae bacterium]